MWCTTFVNNEVYSYSVNSSKFFFEKHFRQSRKKISTFCINGSKSIRIPRSNQCKNASETEVDLHLSDNWEREKEWKILCSDYFYRANFIQNKTRVLTWSEVSRLAVGLACNYELLGLVLAQILGKKAWLAMPSKKLSSAHHILQKSSVQLSLLYDFKKWVTLKNKKWAVFQHFCQFLKVESWRNQ